MQFKETEPVRPARKSTKATTAVADPMVETAPVAAAAPVVAVERDRTLTRIELFIYWLLGIVEAFLAIRLVLALLNSTTDAVNNASGFARFIYDVSDPLCQPFFGLYNVGNGLEPTVAVIITAMVVYALVGWAIGRLVRIGRV